MICSGTNFVRTDCSRTRTLGDRLKSGAFGLFALSALIALAGARAAFAADASASGDSESNWVRVDSAPGGESGDQVLEIPQVACDEDSASSPCDNDDDGGAPTKVASSPASPQTFDDDTADAGSGWASADDYSSETIYAFPYGVAQYGTVYGPVPSTAPANQNRPPVRPSPFPPMEMSSPVTQAAQPPLNPNGAWMTPPSMSAFSRPTGNPMASSPFRFH